MNIHAHAGFPPMPFMFEIAAANRPENAPESYEYGRHRLFNYRAVLVLENEPTRRRRKTQY